MTGSTPRSRWIIGGAALLAVAIIALALQAIRSEPVLDDRDMLQYVNVASGGIGRGLDCYHLFRPVKTLFFATIGRGFNRTPVIPHVFSLLLYLSATALAFRFFLVLTPSRPWALAATALWATAPPMVSALVWFSCANILVMAIALLGAFLLNETAWRPDTGLRWPRAFAVAGLFLVGLLSYESAIVFPALIVLRDVTRGNHRLAGHPRRPLYLLLTAVAALYLAARAAGGADIRLANANFAPMTTIQLVLSSAHFFMDHLATWVWPFGRQSLHGTYTWGRSISASGLVLCWVLLGALVASAWTAWRGRALRQAGFGILWFLIAFLPTGNFAPLWSGPYGDYYLLFPSLGLALGLVILFQSVSAGRSPSSRPRRLMAVALLTLLIAWRAGAAALAFDWAQAWNDAAELHRRTLITRPHDYASRANLAREYLLAGDFQTALEQLDRAAADAPWYAPLWYVRGDIRLKQGQAADAAADYRRARELQPRAPYPHFALGFVHENHLGDEITARENYRAVLALPWSAYSQAAALNLSRLLAIAGQLDEALAVIRDALAYAPDSAELHHNAIVACKQKGDEDSARWHIAEYERIKARQPR